MKPPTKAQRALEQAGERLVKLIMKQWRLDDAALNQNLIKAGYRGLVPDAKETKR